MRQHLFQLLLPRRVRLKLEGQLRQSNGQCLGVRLSRRSLCLLRGELRWRRLYFVHKARGLLRERHQPVLDVYLQLPLLGC